MLEMLYKVCSRLQINTLLYGSGCMHLILAEHKCLTQIFSQSLGHLVPQRWESSVWPTEQSNTTMIRFVQRIRSIHGGFKKCYNSKEKNKGDPLLENSGNNDKSCLKYISFSLT